MQEYAGAPTRKLSEGKTTWPGRKQVHRIRNGDGHMERDVITLEDEVQEGEPLLEPIMREGRRVAPPSSIAEIRDRVRTVLSNLPPALRRLEPARRYRVEISESVRGLNGERLKAQGVCDLRFSALGLW